MTIWASTIGIATRRTAVALALAVAACSDPTGGKAAGEPCVSSSECGPGLLCDLGAPTPVCAMNATIQVDAAVVDAAVIDAAEPDAATVDARAIDARGIDATAIDAAEPDAAPPVDAPTPVDAAEPIDAAPDA